MRRLCVCLCVRACVRMCVCARVCVCVCVCARARVAERYKEWVGLKKMKALYSPPSSSDQYGRGMSASSMSRASPSGSLSSACSRESQA